MSDPIVHLEANDFPARAREALTDTTLRETLDHVTDLFGTKRQAAVDTQPEWEAMRTRAAAIKEQVLANLAEHLEAFVTRAEATGVKVHFARDREEACRILAELAEAHGAQTVAKAKSMTTEEVGLNEVLESRGMTPVETDLGEYIVQLAGELPSHIIAPAIHKTRGQIGELFQAELGEDYTDDVQELAAIARQVLRRTFIEADLGVTGVNFGVVETGSFLLIENEGNIRMSSSLPRVHVALMGIEKLVPRLADLPLFLRLLPRSATGQHISVYQSLFTGPKRSPEDEGPEEVHLVLLDNGRSSMLRDPLTRQSLACVRCGACLNACPVYKQVGGHAYGSVYPGPIGAILTPQLAGIERAAPLPYASSLCGACRDVCPVKIDIPRLLLHLRARATATPALRRGRERLAFRLWAWFMGGKRRYALAARLMRLGWPLRALAAPARAWQRGRALRAPAPRSFRQLWKELDR
jgi:L-lactate dehydrogenase complex protein LldF